jgi:hypothetical protein
MLSISQSDPNLLHPLLQYYMSCLYTTEDTQVFM